VRSFIIWIVVNGRTTYDFTIFRTGRKHPIGMYDEINSFVSFVKDAAEGGSSKEMAFYVIDNNLAKSPGRRGSCRMPPAKFVKLHDRVVVIHLTNKAGVIRSDSPQSHLPQ
jgi:hypothetical protein